MIIPVLDFGAAALVFGAFGLVLTHMARKIPNWPRRLCGAILITSMLASVADVLVRSASPRQVGFPLYRAMMVLQSLLSPFPMLLIFAYILWCCGENFRKNRLLYVLCILSALMAACSVLLECTAELGDASLYEMQMGVRAVLLVILSSALAVLTFVAVFRRRKKLTRAQLAMFVLSLFSSRSAVILIMEFLLGCDLISRYLAQQEENERQRTRLAVAQMQPHFLYNTLLSVYYLCAQDAAKSQQVIRDFIRYLQSNFTSIGEDKPILFEKELEHTKAYLAVEQACNEGRLFVEFDTPATRFRLPALTLQPIVENAVKHGLSPGLPPLRVSVATQETAGGVRITVEDTGPGFPQPADDAPHTALDNIRQRLKTMCGGTMEIEPREEGGTRVTMFVPRRSS